MPRPGGILLLVPLFPLTLGLTFTAGSVLGSDLAQAVLQPSPSLPQHSAGSPVAAAPTPAGATILGVEGPVALLIGVILVLLVILSLVIMSKA